MKYTDAELVTLVSERFKAAYNGRNSCKGAKDNIRLYLENPVTIGNGTKKQPALNVNLLYVAIENLASLQSDTPVTINIIHKNPGTELDAKVYQAGVQWVLEQNRINRLRESSQKYSMLFGTGVLSCSVDPDKKEIGIESGDTRMYVLDPLAKTPNDITYRIKVCYYTKSELKKLYPKWTGIETQQNRVSGTDGTSDLLNEIELFNEQERNTDSELITVYEMIWKDTPDDYPNGRFTITTDSELLNDEPFEYLCGVTPDAFMACVSMPDRVFGIDLVKYIKPITDELNIIWKRLSIMIKKCSNPQKLVSGLAGIDLDNITNADGQVHIVRNLIDVRGSMTWEAPVQITESIYAFVEKLQQLFQIVSGMTDMSIGYAQIQSSMPSGISLERLQAATQTRLRQMVRNRNEGFVDLGKILVALIHQYFDDEKMIRISGMDAQSIAKVMQKEKMEAAQQVLQAGARTPEEIQMGVELFNKGKGVKLVKMTDNDIYLSFNGKMLEDPTKFDVTVTAGLDVPKSKVDIASATKELFAMGQVDLQSYLESIDHPYKDQILARSQAWGAFKQFMAMQQQQMNAQTGAEYGKQPQADTGSVQGDASGNVPINPGEPVPTAQPNTPDQGSGGMPSA